MMILVIIFQSISVLCNGRVQSIYIENYSRKQLLFGALRMQNLLFGFIWIYLYLGQCG